MGVPVGQDAHAFRPLEFGGRALERQVNGIHADGVSEPLPVPWEIRRTPNDEAGLVGLVAVPLGK
jgi:hypothetical protein